LPALGQQPVRRVRGGSAWRRIVVIVWAVVACLLLGPLTGCSWIRPSEREGGTLVVAVPESIPVLDPHRAAAPHPLFGMVYDTLLSRTPDLGLAPGLATGWRVLEGGLQVALDLRGGVAFHDGTPLNGPAVAKNIERIMNGEAGEFPIQELLGPLREVQASDRQVVLIYDRPFPPVWQALSDPRLGMVSPRALDVVPGEETSPPGALGMPGTGPYRVTTRDPSRVVLERNPLYKWPPGSVRNSGRAFPEGLIVVAVPPADEDGETGEGSGDAGPNWDLLWWPAGEAVPPAADEKTKDWRRFPFGGERTAYLALEARSSPFTDPFVRQSILAAIDRPGIVAAAPWPSQAALGVLPSAQGGLLGEPDAPDPATAERMLDAAGWERSEDGHRRKDGGLLELRLATYEGEPGFQALAALVCAALDGLGLDCRVVAARPQAAPGLLPSGPNAWLLYYQWPDPDVLFYLFHSSQAGRTNRTGYANPSVDALLEAARAEMDPDARTGLYLEAQALILGDGYVLPLFESRGEVRVSPDAAGFRPWRDGRLVLHDVYLKQAP